MSAPEAPAPRPRENDVHCQELPHSLKLKPYVQQILHTYGTLSRCHRFTIPPSDGLFVGLNCGAPLTSHFSDRSEHIEPGLFVCGQLQHEIPIISCQGQFSLISIQLTPTGFFRLFNTAASPYTDRLTALKQISAEAEALEAGWLRQPTTSDLVSTIECSLLAQEAGKHDPVDDVEQAVATMARCDGLIRVDEVAKQCHVSTRQLRRRFRKVVGVAPKYFAKSLQIKAIMAQLAIKGDMPLRLLAHDHGYFDQSHFIHDFQRLIGVKPTVFQQDDSAFLSTYLSQYHKPGPAGATHFREDGPNKGNCDHTPTDQAKK